jgi:HPt (histidine-containing phosphotransfer) domain-containing protein
MTNPDVLDPAVVDSLRQLTPPGEPDVLGEVLRLFLDEVPRRVARLKAAWDARNAGELQRAAHSLKGSSGNIGAHHMYEICKQLDERGTAGDFNGARHLIDALDEEYTRVEAEIHRLLG